MVGITRDGTETSSLAGAAMPALVLGMLMIPMFGIAFIARRRGYWPSRISDAAEPSEFDEEKTDPNAAEHKSGARSKKSSRTSGSGIKRGALRKGAPRLDSEEPGEDDDSDGSDEGATPNSRRRKRGARVAAADDNDPADDVSGHFNPLDSMRSLLDSVRSSGYS